MADVIEDKSAEEKTPDRGWLNELVHGFIDLLYPACCLLCGRTSPRDICDNCLSALIPLIGSSCPRCGNPADRDAPCMYCLSHEFLFDKVVSLYAYEEPLRDALLDFKYHREYRKGEALAGLFLQILDAPEIKNSRLDLVIPVPITPKRKQKRSYNQSELLAQTLADALGISSAPYGLMRRRETRTQTGLDFAQRMANVADAFVAPDTSIIKGKRILLVDDIITTGATSSAAAGALKKAGASYVVAASLARGIPR